MRVCSVEAEQNRISKKNLAEYKTNLKASDGHANLAEYKTNLKASEGHNTNTKVDLALYKASFNSENNDGNRITKVDLARYNAKLNSGQGDRDGYLMRAWRAKNCCTKVNLDWQQPNCCQDVTDFDCFKQYRERIRPTIGCVRPMKLQATENLSMASHIPTGREQLTVTGTAGTGNLESNLEQNTGGGVTGLVSDLSCTIPGMTNTNSMAKTGRPAMTYWPSALPWMYKSHRKTEARSKYPLRPSPRSRRRRVCPPDPCTFGTMREVHDNVPTVPSLPTGPSMPAPSIPVTEPSAPAFQPRHTVETLTLKIPKSQKDQIRARLAAARAATTDGGSIKEHVKETVAEVEVQEIEKTPEEAVEAVEAPVETDVAEEGSPVEDNVEEVQSEEAIEEVAAPADEVIEDEEAVPAEEAVEEVVPEEIPDEEPLESPVEVPVPETNPVEASQDAGTEPKIEAKTVHTDLSRAPSLELKPKHENIHVVVQILTPRQKKKDAVAKT